MSQTQKALFLESKFGEFNLRETSIPKPAPGQLLVRAEAAALNPVDWKIQKWGLFLEEFPVILGIDVAGVVEELGEGVSGFAKGDRVLFQTDWINEFGGFQQYLLSHAVTTAKIPSHISFDEAASIPAASAAAVIGLYLPQPKGAGLPLPFDPSTRGTEAGKPILISGGATSVGQYAIQFAKLSGFSPILTTASLKHENHLKSLGATHVLDRRLSTEELAAEIRNITSKPIETVFDAVSVADTQATGYSILAKGGSLCVLLPPEVEAEEDKPIYHIYGKFTLPYTKDLGATYYSKFTELLEAGDIKPNKVEVVEGGLGGIVAGLKRMELDQVSGVKLIVRPQETA